MKYALIDSELHVHQRDSDIYLPLSIAEMHSIVGVLNALEGMKVEAVNVYLDPKMKQIVSMLDFLSPASAGMMIQRAEALLDDEPKTE